MTKIIKAARDVIKIQSNLTYAGIDTNGTVYHHGYSLLFSSLKI